MNGRTFGPPRDGDALSMRGRRAIRKGASAVLGASLALTACSESGPTPPGPLTSALQQQGGTHVGLLLPMTGRNARLGQDMANAAKIALPDGGKAVLDIRDTDGPSGAGAAARAAIEAGDRIILGPLTAAQTGEVGSVAQAAGVPELAYTSDVSKARQGVWVLGLTPEQQAQRLVVAAKAEGRRKFAAFLPDSALGHALARGLMQACEANGLETPNVAFHGSDVASISNGLKTLSDFDARQKAAQPTPGTPAADPDAVNPLAADPAPGTAPPSIPPSAGSAPSTSPSAVSLGAPPFDALLLGDTGLQLAGVIAALKESQIGSAQQVRILGPALWGAFASKLSTLHGAWFAAPDPRARAGYAQQYQRRYGVAPKPMTDMAYDSAALAGALVNQPSGLTLSSLTRSDGFAGVDGVFALRPDGQVTRGLAVFEISPAGGASIVHAAPTRLVATPS